MLEVIVGVNSYNVKELIYTKLGLQNNGFVEKGRSCLWIESEIKPRQIQINIAIPWLKHSSIVLEKW